MLRLFEFTAAAHSPRELAMMLEAWPSAGAMSHWCRVASVLTERGLLESVGLPRLGVPSLYRPSGLGLEVLAVARQQIGVAA